MERRVTPPAAKRCARPLPARAPEDIERLKALQLEVHDTFIDIVKERRRTKLKNDPDLFTGLFWSGKRGVELGLVDLLAICATLKARYGDKRSLN